MSSRGRAGRICVLSLFACLAVAGPAGAQRATHVYRAQHRSAEELLPLVETALAGEAMVALDARTNSLVLVGEGRAIAVALELLALQDRAPRSVVVRVESQRATALARDGLRVEWALAAGDLRVGHLRAGAPPAGPGEGASPVLGSGVAVQAGAVRARGDGEFSALLRILEGEVGEIASGHVVPFAARGPRGVAPVLVEVRSGLLARPRVLGDGHVQLDLAPFEGEIGQAGELAFAGSSTRAVLAPGETLVVGGLRRAEGASGTSLEGAERSTASEDRVLLLHVEID